MPTPAPPPAIVRPVALRCEYAVNPLGIGTASPRLMWALQTVDASARGGRQSAWQVHVSTGAAGLRSGAPDLWDSGKVRASAREYGAVYRGAPLRSGRRAWWRVRVWDGRGRPSAWSPAAWFETGLLESGDWTARWIRAPGDPPATPEAHYADRPAPLLRREFNVTRPVRRARLYATGLGYHELRLNGHKVGDALLDPPWTNYARRVHYTAHDVTALLTRGANVLGCMLGSGWWDPLPLRLFGRWNLRETLPVGAPRLLCQLHIEYADGSREVVRSDETWQAAPGPVLRNSVYLGEHYDARLERAGWDAPGYDAGSWRSAETASEPVGALEAMPLPPIRAARTVRAAAVSSPAPGVQIADFGQNLAGRVRLTVEAPAGTRITLRYGELLYPNGTLNPMTSVATQLKHPGAGGPGAPDVAVQTDSYTCRGGGPETWSPRFTFHGFRYVEVTGWPGTLSRDGIQAQLLQTDVPAAGAFACSEPLLQRLWDVADWTFRSNLFSVQSDCPHREKLGYGGDIVATSESFMLAYDMSRFYAKTVHDFADAVRPNHGFTETAPFVGIADAGLGEGSGPVEWGAAHPLLVWQLWQYYGNRRLMEEQYPAVTRYVELLRRHAREGILDNGIGDHEALDRAPRPVTGTAYYWLCADVAARIAQALDKPDDARRWAALSDEVKRAFAGRFVDGRTGRVEGGSQAAHALALDFGLAPAAARPRVVQALEQAVAARDGHLSTGIFGTRALLLALSDAGRHEAAVSVATRQGFPGWEHMLQGGATTLWESWAFSDNVYSHNHPMFGSVVEWMMKHVAGIAPEADAVGFDRVRIAPRPAPGLTRARGTVQTVRGPVAVEWRATPGRLTLTCRVPPGVTARVRVPALRPEGVLESGVPARQAHGVLRVRAEPDALTCEVGGGRYRFEAPWPR